MGTKRGDFVLRVPRQVKLIPGNIEDVGVREGLTDAENEKRWAEFVSMQAEGSLRWPMVAAYYGPEGLHSDPREFTMRPFGQGILDEFIALYEAPHFGAAVTGFVRRYGFLRAWSRSCTKLEPLTQSDVFSTVRLAGMEGLWFGESIQDWGIKIWEVRYAFNAIRAVQDLPHGSKKLKESIRDIELSLLLLHQSARLHPVLQWSEPRSAWSLGVASFAEKGEPRFNGVLSAALYWLLEGSLRDDVVICDQCRESYRPKRAPKVGHAHYCPVCRNSKERRAEWKRARRQALKAQTASGAAGNLRPSESAPDQP